MTTRDLSDVIDKQLPYDGPHSEDTVTQAAHGLYHLVRYLNNATQPSMSDHTLPSAATVDEVLGELTATLGATTQLLSQLSHAIASGEAGKDVYDDRDVTNPNAGEQTAADLRHALIWLHDRITDAHETAHHSRTYSAHLGNKW